MRFEKVANLLNLARRIAGSAEGMTLDEMAAELGMSRSTAERQKNILQQLFPQMDEVADGSSKRFRIRGGLDSFLSAPSAGELAALGKAADELGRRGLTEDAASLVALEKKIRSVMRDATLQKLAPDIEALLRAELIAVQAGPRPVENPDLMLTLRSALLAMKALRFNYHGATSRAGAVREVAPCGIIFGRMNYLIATESGSTKPKHYRLDRIKDAEVLDKPASPPDGFSLVQFANSSFGFFQGEPEDVVLRVLSEGIEDNFENWRFHPTQTIEHQADGSAIVRFRASGMLELAWHLFTWGNKIQIIAPESLRESLKYELRKASTQHEVAPPLHILPTR